jgi:uncharacterized membrane protein SirB2
MGETLYLSVKAVHMGCAMLSVGGFVVRGGMMLAESPVLNARFVRVAPHVVDTILLASALWLAWALEQLPFVSPWVTAKLLALVVYIGLGTVALKRGRTKRVRLAAFAGALATAVYIVAVAITRDPTPWS